MRSSSVRAAASAPSFSDSRAASDKASWLTSMLTPEALGRARALREIARGRGQTLAQMALAWLLKDERLTSVLIGASKPEQITDCVGCLANLRFEAAELAEIERILALP